ncbi:MAG: hypothetical protein K0R26_1897 [Bacteroidota bacterium]|jgi:integrase|nr:hypothetical protein [Bacteroidota bacterium]
MENYQLAKIVDRGGDLTARWFVEYKYKHPETGKFVKFREWISAKITTRSGRYQKATALKASINLKLKSGFSPFEAVERQRTLKDCITSVLELKAVTCGKRAKITYKSIGGLFLNWIEKNNLSTVKPEEINKALAQRFLDYLLIDKKVSNRTYNNYLVCLRTIFEVLLEREAIDFNVWKKLKKLKVKEADITAFTAAECKRVAEIVPVVNYQLYAAAMLIYYCYLRPAEIVRLKIQDLDLVKGQILVKASQSKNGCNQVVIMHQELIKIIEKMNLNAFPSDYYVFGTSKLLKPGPREIAPTRIADAWREQFKKPYGFTKNIYDLKPTGNGAALDSGIDTRDIQLQNRHHSLDQTQRYLNKFRNKPGNVFREKMPVFNQ